MTRPWLDANGNTFPYRKLIHVASLKARIGWQSLRTDEFVDEGPYCVTGTDFQNGRVNWSTAYHVSTERYEMDRNIQLNEGDLLVTKDGTIGKVAVVHGLDAPATLNSGVFVVRPKTSELSTDFLGWVIRSKVFDDFVAFNFSGSTINHLYQNVFETFRFPFPDLATQRQIADFLDRETARIDLLIEKKQRLVALLGEKFETETTRLMTCGVRGDLTEFAKSIYHWAPDVPSHWTQTPLRQLLRLASGSVGEKSGDYVLLSLTKQGVIPRDVESGKGKFPSDFSAYQVVKPDQLVLCLFDIDETPRTVGLSNEYGMVTGAYTVADINADRVDRDFIYFHLLYIDNGKRLRPFYTGLRKVVRPQTLLNIRIPLPPMEEQKQIVQELQHWERRAKSISEKTNASIDRLKEYRSALITAAVTGQIDVSTYAKSGTPDRRLDAIQEEMGA
ncbi:restriction endonuclease subunit S [Roseovarius aestuariivivens]|uniref:restriction endonuclease subunit S n=1 Tax=Roseovarius aestuariivivens TaxID=1888910 RepID=UPI001081C379|nr:restriction endonuclease subunit S [Roseovarius aestuariivivens]